ncbi:MAG: dimethylarginine dimethylaminohydrolase family protein [Thermoplasmata archaeon]
MTGTSWGEHALVRGVPTTYERCVTGLEVERPVNLSLAQEQHGFYCETLQALGLELIRVEPDDRFPDCCFVEDPAVVVGDIAVLTRMGAPSRVGEESAIRDALRPHRKTREIHSPGTLEGGDVVRIDEKIYVGLSRRTNQAGLDQLDALVSELGFRVIPVRVHRGLHLKSSCTSIGEGSVVLLRGNVEEDAFSEHNVIDIPREEAPAADCLRVRDRVLVLEGYPISAKRIESEGFDTMPLPMSEFEKCEGALTCLSIIF